jgi:hypothetical protein
MLLPFHAALSIPMPVSISYMRRTLALSIHVLFLVQITASRRVYRTFHQSSAFIHHPFIFQFVFPFAS